MPESDGARQVIARMVQAVLWIAVCGYAAFVILSLFGTPVGEFDDAIPLVGGMLVKQGLTPGPDFYTVYPPLGLYVDAFLFGLFGRTVVATRAFDAALYVALLFLASRFFRRRLPHASPLVPLATLLFVTGIGSAVTAPSWPGFVISLAGLFVYLSPRDPQKNPLFAVAASGTLTGISFLYRANFAGYVAAAVVIGLLLRRNFKEIGAFALPILVCSAVFYPVVYGTDALVIVPRIFAAAAGAIAVHFITLEFSHRLVFALMFPPLWFCFRIWRDGNARSVKLLVAAGIAIALPVVALAGGTYTSIPYLLVSAEVASVILFHLFARRLDQFELALLLFYCCNLHYYLSRADLGHFAFIPIALAMLLPFAWFNPWPNPTFRRWAALVLPGIAFLLIVETAVTQPEISKARIGAHILAGARHNAGKSDTELVVDSAPAPAWAALYPDENELQAIRYLRDRTSSSDPIFVGYRDHSRIFLNDLRFYWLANRPVAVRTFELESGHATEAAVQREIIEDLQRRHVSWLVLDMSLQYFGDPGFEPAADAGSELLDAYIGQNFQPVARFGRYGIFASR